MPSAASHSLDRFIQDSILSAMVSSSSEKSHDNVGDQNGRSSEGEDRRLSQDVSRSQPEPPPDPLSQQHGQAQAHRKRHDHDLFPGRLAISTTKSRESRRGVRHFEVFGRGQWIGHGGYSLYTDLDEQAFACSTRPDLPVRGSTFRQRYRSCLRSLRARPAPCQS